MCSLLALTVVGMVSGCASVPNSYVATELPARYHASANVNTQTLDLSKLTSSPVNTDMISGGDLLEVSISAGNANSQPVVFPVRVGSNGVANVDSLGPIRLAGLELDEAEAAIRQEGMRQQYYVNPRVTVAMKRKKVHRILVMGAVENPGEKLIPASNANLLSAIFAAGGLTDDAGANVEITNLIDKPALPDAIAQSPAGDVSQVGYTGVPRSARVNLVSAAQEGSNSYFIGDGGAIYVEKRDPKAIHVGGLVTKPGRINFPVNQDLHLDEALALAGDVKTQVADKIFVFRQLPGQPERVRIQCSLSRMKKDPTENVLLAPGDVVRVEHSPATVLLEAIQIIRFAVTANAASVL